MSEAEKRAELRRIVREAVQLYHKEQLSEVELRDMVPYAMALEMNDIMKLSVHVQTGAKYYWI